MDGSYHELFIRLGSRNLLLISIPSSSDFRILGKVQAGTIASIRILTLRHIFSKTFQSVSFVPTQR